MMGRLDSGQDKLFYSFNLDHVPQSHLLRGIDRFLDLRDLPTWCPISVQEQSLAGTVRRNLSHIQEYL